MKLLLALLLIASAPPITMDKQVDVLAAMLDPAQIEDDLGERDIEMNLLTTVGCETVIETEGKNYRIDWAKPAVVMMADTFVFIEAPGIKLAIVGDASKKRQHEVLTTLAWAMNELAAKCAAPPTGN